MPQVQVHFVGQLHDLVIAGGVHVPWLHVVVQQSVCGTVQVYFTLNYLTRALTNHASSGHVLFEGDVLED